MGTKVIGKLDNWTDGDIGGNDFMNLEEGVNQVRIVSQPYQFHIHWTNDATGTKRKIRCAGENCPLCLNGEKSSARWYVAVINRKTNRPAVLELGPQIFKQILGLSKKDKWGEPTKYDIDIERQPKGSQPLYVVSPNPKELLSEQDVAMVNEFKTSIDLKKMVAFPTPDEVREKLGLSKSTKTVSNDFDDTPKENSKAKSSDDDDDFDF
jgi:hypothetical protein